jgi:hypothetical protein
MGDTVSSERMYKVDDDDDDDDDDSAGIVVEKPLSCLKNSRLL